MKFTDSVISVVGGIPLGRVTCYGEIAKVLGNVRLARAVGYALNRNPAPIRVPCHRVVYSDGRIGGYSRGIPEKIRLLESEGILVENNRVKNFREVFVSASQLRI